MNTNRTRHELKMAMLLAGMVSFAGTSALLADQIVYFQNGKAIMVKSIEKGDKLTILEVEGGGKIGVPTSQIVRIEDYLITANEGIPTGGTPGLPQPAPVAAALPLNAPAQANAGAQPLNRPTGGGFDGAPLAAGQGVGIPAPLPVGTQGQGSQAGQPIRARYPMSPLQGLARGGADGRMESPVSAGPGAGRQMTPFGLRHARGNDGRVGGSGLAPGSYQEAQALAAQMRAARPQAPPATSPAPAPAPPSEPAMDAATPDTTAAPDNPAADPEDTDADTPDDEPSVEN